MSRARLCFKSDSCTNENFRSIFSSTGHTLVKEVALVAAGREGVIASTFGGVLAPQRPEILRRIVARPGVKMMTPTVSAKVHSFTQQTDLRSDWVRGRNLAPLFKSA